MVYAIAAGTAALAAPANAGRATASMRVTTNVLNSCTVQAQPLSFGTQPIIQVATIDATAIVIVRCGANTAFTVAMDNGQYFATNRRVYNAGWNQYLTYEVYSDSARTQVWGSTAGRTVAGNSGATGQTTLTAYGRIVSPGIVLPGAYTDLVTVTVNF